jgi:DNA-binding NtrC family response regulator
LHLSDSQKFLETCFQLVASSVPLPPDGLLEAFQTLYFRHKADIDRLIKNLDRAFKPYGGNAAAENLMKKFEEELKINELNAFAGPQLRNRFYSYFVDSYGSNLDTHILIQGPSGTGKTSVVKAIKANGKRCDREMRRYDATQGETVWNQLVEDVENDPGLEGGVVWLDELQRFVDAKDQQWSLLQWPEKRDIQIITASSSDYTWLKANLVPDFAGRYCMRVFTIPRLKDREHDFKEFTIQYVAATYSKNIDPKLVERLRQCHEWDGNHREIIAFVERLFGCLPPHRVTVNIELIERHLEKIEEPAITILRKIPELAIRA